MADVHNSLLDRLKMASVFLSLLVGIFLFYYMSDQILLYRVIAILTMVIIAITLFFLTKSGKNTAVFLQGAQVELQKTVWPTKAETVHTTLLIFVAVLIVALFLWALDLFLAWFMQIIIK
ncbi:MAG: preprotein translocase subunit SecE [Chromatiales bacterium]|nr:preprotein translocase subunit SecE [Chromatiales bacterium]